MLAGFILFAVTVVVGLVGAHPQNSWNLKSFKSFVAFGDSYTDENRLGYFINNKGQAPPVGWVQPEVCGNFSFSFAVANSQESQMADQYRFTPGSPLKLLCFLSYAFPRPPWLQCFQAGD
jgi:hypothetical protein